MADVTGLTSADIDANGKQLITSDDVRDILAVDLIGSSFWSPDVSFSGFAANGDEYLEGVPTGERASWATEAEGLHRGPLSRLPRRFWAVLTARELSIIDARDRTLVIRFLASETIPPLHEVDIQEILSDTGAPPPFPRVVRARLASPEALGVQSVVVNNLAATFAVVDTETLDIDIPAAVDAEPLHLLTFTVVFGVPGIFLEFEPDEDSLNFGSGLGNIGSSRRISWASGRFIVVGSNGTRFLDFRNDRALAITAAGTYSAAIPAQSGLEFRNKDEYFSPVVISDVVTGVANSHAVASFRSGTTAYYVVGKSTGAVVFVWPSGDFLPTSIHTDLERDAVDIVIGPEGILYLLAGPPPLQLFRSVALWRTSDFSTIPIAFPFDAGGFGRMALRGTTLFTSTRVGVWSNDTEDFDDPSLTYGGNIATVLVSQYPLLRASGQEIDDIAVDPQTGRLGVLHGDAIDVVNVGRNTLEETLSYASDPEIPVVLRVLNASAFPYGES